VEFLGDGQPGGGAAFPHEDIVIFVADDEHPAIVTGAEARAGGVELADDFGSGECVDAARGEGEFDLFLADELVGAGKRRRWPCSARSSV
jgi:hypothetical protein